MDPHQDEPVIINPRPRVENRDAMESSNSSDIMGSSDAMGVCRKGIFVELAMAHIDILFSFSAIFL